MFRREDEIECFEGMYYNVKKSTKLNGGNLVHGVNTQAVCLLRYSAAFVSWRGKVNCRL